MNNITESEIEQASLDWFKGLGYSVLNGPDIAHGELFAERASYSYVVLKNSLSYCVRNGHSWRRFEA